MKPNSFIKIIAFFILAALISCEKEETESNKVKDWFEYTNYIPFPENDVMWLKISDGQIVIPPVEGGEEPEIRGEYVVHSKYFFSGDTSINGLNYKKTYNRVIDTTLYNSDEIYRLSDTTFYLGAFRQSVELKKVFFILPDSDEELLLYDFNISLGDTIDSYLCRYSTYSVSCIDSILINERYHNIYYLRNGNLLNAAFIIEGIGNPFGPFNYYAEPGFNGPECEFYYKDLLLHLNFSIMSNCN